MGVNNLWQLLAPVGRRINIETLENKVLAVDASIWLTQFVKAMRDDEGRMIRHAHLIGTFRRVAKLLFHRIRPVFVFDGVTPALKKRTVMARRMQRERQNVSLKRTAQKLLLNELRLKALKQRKKEFGNDKTQTSLSTAGTSRPKATVASFRSLTTTNGEGDSSREKERREGKYLGDGGAGESAVERRSPTSFDLTKDSDVEWDDEEETEVQPRSAQKAPLPKSLPFSLPSQHGSTSAPSPARPRRTPPRPYQYRPRGRHQPRKPSSASSSSALLADDGEGGLVETEAGLDSVDLDAMAALPPDLQKDAIDKVLRNQRQKARQMFLPLAGNPAAYSNAQLSQFLKSSAFNKQVDRIRKRGGEEREEGQRIASDSTRKFIFAKLKDKTNQEQEDEAQSQTVSSILSVSSQAATVQLVASAAPSMNKQGEVFDIDDESQEREDEEGFFTPPSSPPSPANVAPPSSQSSENELPLALSEDESARSKPEHSKKSSPIEKDSATDAKGERQQEEEQDEKEYFEIEINPRDIQEGNLLDPSLFRDSNGNRLEERVETVRSESEIEWEEEELPVEPEPLEDRGDKKSENSILPVNVVREELPAPIPSEETRAEVICEERERGSLVTQSPSASPAALSLEARDQEDGDRHSVSAVPVSDTSDAILVSSSEEEEEKGGGKGKAESAIDLYITGGYKDKAKAASAADPLESALSTAQHLPQWAGFAVKRTIEMYKRTVKAETDTEELSAVSVERTASLTIGTEETPQVVEESQELIESEDPNEEELRRAIALSLATTEVEANQEAKEEAEESKEDRETSEALLGNIDDLNEEDLQQEQRELKENWRQQQRDTDGVTEDMTAEVMELLAEAEAQCATLERLGLVDGVITEDSDCLLFGAGKVYKNIFDDKKYVEAYLIQDIQRELGLDRMKLINLALLLGSDYTDGVKGVGIVNATEIVDAFEGEQGLVDFKRWLHSLDPQEDIYEANKKLSEFELSKLSKLQRFRYKHRSYKRRWDVNERFPDQMVIRAYLQPEVDESSERFSWALPDLAGIRDYCRRMFGWEESVTNGTMLPLLKQLNSNHRQTRLDSFFIKYDDHVKFARIKSKRLRSAVEELAMAKRSKTAQGRGKAKREEKEDNQNAQPSRSPSARKKEAKKRASGAKRPRGEASNGKDNDFAIGQKKKRAAGNVSKAVGKRKIIQR